MKVYFDSAENMPEPFRSIYSFDHTKARIEIEKAKNLKSIEFQSLNVLQFAALVGNIEAVRHIMSRKEFLVIEEADEEFILHTYSRTNNDEMIIEFVKKGIDVNKTFFDYQDDVKSTALIHASGRGHLALVHVLINAGADANAESENRQFPLLAAASAGHEDIYRLLYPLTRESLRVDAEEEVLRRGIVLRKRRENMTLEEFIANVCIGRTDLVLEHLKRGVDINSFDSEGETALYAASSRGYLEISQILIEYGADVNRGTEEEDITPLMAICRSSLISNDPNMKLYQKKMVELLIKSGSDVNKQDQKGETALHGACRNRLSEIVALLIKAGAKVDIESEKGTALDLAKKAGHQEVVEILQDQSV